MRGAVIFRCARLSWMMSASSSVWCRVRACQVRGRGFESRLALQIERLAMKRWYPYFWSFVLVSALGFVVFAVWAAHDQLSRVPSCACLCE